MIMLNALTRLPGANDAFTLVILFGLLSTALLYAATWVGETRRCQSWMSWLKSVGAVIGVGTLLAFMSWLAVSTHLASMPMLTPDDPGAGLHLLGGYEALIWIIIFSGLTSIVLLVVLLAHGVPRSAVECLPHLASHC